MIDLAREALRRPVTPGRVPEVEDDGTAPRDRLGQSERGEVRRRALQRRSLEAMRGVLERLRVLATGRVSDGHRYTTLRRTSVTSSLCIAPDSRVSIDPAREVGSIASREARHELPWAPVGFDLAQEPRSERVRPEVEGVTFGPRSPRRTTRGAEAARDRCPCS